MRIAIFTNNYLPNPYGVTVSIESFRKELEKRGHDVYIFAPRLKEYEDSNLNVYRYSSIDIKYKIRFPLPIPYSQRVERVLRDTPMDIVHSQHPNLLGVAARRWAKKNKAPLIFTWHTLYDQYTHFAPPLIPQKLVVKSVIRNAVRYANRSDQVIVPTASVKRIIRSWGVKNPYVNEIATGIDEETHNDPDPSSVRDQYNLSRTDKMLFTVSRLTEEKNVKFLLQSLAPALQKDPHLKFIISGSGDLLEELRTFVKAHAVTEQVFFTGIVSNHRIKDYCAACDVFVYASKSETQGLVIAEAMYAGAPVVALRAPGVQDMIMDKVTGFLVEEDEGKFRKAVQHVLEQTEQSRNFSLKAREIAKKTLTSTVCTDALLSVYDAAISRYKHSKI